MAPPVGERSTAVEPAMAEEAEVTAVGASGNVGSLLFGVSS